MVYWVSTGLLAAFLTLSAGSYLFHEGTIVGVRELGFPDFFRVQLALLKMAATVALLVPMTPVPLKEWAYAGVTLFILTAIVAHAAHGDSVVLHVINAAMLGLVLTSRFTDVRLSP